MSTRRAQEQVKDLITGVLGRDGGTLVQPGDVARQIDDIYYEEHLNMLPEHNRAMLEGRQSWERAVN